MTIKDLLILLPMFIGGILLIIGYLVVQNFIVSLIGIILAFLPLIVLSIYIPIRDKRNKKTKEQDKK